MSVQVRHDLDIGNHVNSVQSIASALRHKLLTNAYSPPSDYAFRLDSKGSRRFQHSWLQKYQWLACSPLLKGPMCKVCVVFPQPVHRGFTGAFISAPCVKYNDFHNCTQKHVSSVWHRQSQEDATKFLNTVLHPERCCCCCCWLPDPFRGMGAWRKTMEPQKPGNSTGSGPEVIESRQRVSGAKSP